MMEAIALTHAPAHGHEEEYTTTGIPHDKMGMWVESFPFGSTATWTSFWLFTFTAEWLFLMH